MAASGVQREMEAALGARSDRGALSASELAGLVASFSEVTSRLERTHESLRAEVARLKEELHSANAQLRRTRALAALGEMAAGIAHEIRNPLGSIQLYAKALEDDLIDRPDEQAIARKIASSVRGLNRIVCDVLVFARPITLHQTDCSLCELVDRALVASHAHVDGASVAINVDIASRCDAVHADPDLLHQALLNLIHNAVDAINQRDEKDPCNNLREITIRARHSSVRDATGDHQPMLAISVEDTGLGLCDDARERLFQPFYTTKHDGAGLGLAIVYRVLDAHAGRIDAENVKPCSGARFTMYLPVGSATTDDSVSKCSIHTKEGVLL